MKKHLSILLALTMSISMAACGTENNHTEGTTESVITDNSEAETEVAADSNQADIEKTLNLANNADQEWTYDSDADAWILSIVSAVAYPEIASQQGVSVCVPGAYVKGIDSNGDDTPEVTAQTYSAAVKGSLVIDYEAKVTSTNGQAYTAASAPVILNTGAAGYSSSDNSLAGTTYAAEGYINIACGNRGKQDTATDSDGNTYYTGDAPSCLVDQKNATRFVKYNILLGNLPGSVDYFVSTGGSGGGAHATMFAATSNNSDFYDYEIEAGAVGVYKTTDGGYTTSVSIDGKDYAISDGAWGCIAYSAITSLYEADMDMAFEYYLDSDYSFNTAFQKQVAQYLSQSYMTYINDQKLTMKESSVGFDLNEDGDTKDTVDLTIQYDADAHADTNGYYGTYLNLYLAEFTANLQWYLSSLDYADGWTWFDESGNALSNEAVAAMTTEDKAKAFIEGRYAKAESENSMGGPGGGAMPSGGTPPTGGTAPTGGTPPTAGTAPTGGTTSTDAAAATSSDTGTSTDSNGTVVGTPDSGTTQSATSSSNSTNYSSYDEMVASYKSDIEEIQAGDKYGNNIVSLYNPLNYIGQGDTENPVWTKIVMGAAEGDMSMFASLNLEIAWLNSGVDSEIEWQWDGGHVPSEVLGNSFSLYVDQMYGEHVKGAAKITKQAATAQTENGAATEATGKDISSWVTYTDSALKSTFSLADIAAYRTAGASKATPGFDVIDYGQEDYVFGDKEADARHWNAFLLDIFEKYADVLSPLFSQSSN